MSRRMDAVTDPMAPDAIRALLDGDPLPFGGDVSADVKAAMDRLPGITRAAIEARIFGQQRGRLTAEGCGLLGVVIVDAVAVDVSRPQARLLGIQRRFGGLELRRLRSRGRQAHIRRAIRRASQ